MSQKQDNFIKCDSCGKFIKYEEVTLDSYIPLSEYTYEKMTFLCQKCDKKERGLSNA